MPKSSCNTVKL